MSKKTEDKGREAIVLGTDEQGVRVASRGDNGEVMLGHLRDMKDGEAAPFGCDLVSLHPDDENPGHHRMKTIYESPYKRTRKGPPQTANPAYSKGWDRIFGKKMDETVN